MTDETFEPTSPARRPRFLVRFAAAFLIGLLITSAVGVGALYAYDQQYVGRVLPGVRVGSVDLAGLTREQAIAAVDAAYASEREGRILVTTPKGVVPITYESIGRRVDAEALVDAALGVGRDGNPLDQFIADARTALRGVSLEASITFDAKALDHALQRMAREVHVIPRSASITFVDGTFQVVPASDGLTADGRPALAAVVERIGGLDAPDTIEVALATRTTEPNITTAEATAAKKNAERIAAPIILAHGDETWKIGAKTLRPWVTFAPDDAGGLTPAINTKDLPRTLRSLEKKINQDPRNATFKTRGSRIVGVVPSRKGRGIDVRETTAIVRALLAERAQGSTRTEVAPAMVATEPALTTAEAEAAIPKMRRVSQWTTFFPIGEKNGFGANIWIPAMDLDGHVVAPGEEFDFWASIGPITRARGYRDGGAIINGKTEPQGALAGGICSTSTTLFNAALRAGYEMGDRRNHYYYIDRYPLGLDATVFKSDYSTQTMSFTNDTNYPILIRAFKIRDGSAGYVKFELWSVPTGRKVSFSKPIVRNVRPATDTVQYTSSLQPGASKRIEYPVDGKQVWVTRTVRDRKGSVIHKETYYSNYARITGVTLIGRGAS